MVRFRKDPALAAPDGTAAMARAAEAIARAEARSRLGAAFDIRDFHSAVLDHGSLPLAVLGQVVSEWAASAADTKN
jgi:hypothetical protein